MSLKEIEKYKQENVAQSPNCPEGGIKCKNYDLCGDVFPEWWYNCKGEYLCTNCHILFGTWGEKTGKGILEIENDLECPICLQSKKCISHPNCDHKTCIECFKSLYYIDMSNEPRFPYPDIENEYYNYCEDHEHEEDSKWDNEYPLIKVYNEEYKLWDYLRNEKYSNEENLRKCPLCRK